MLHMAFPDGPCMKLLVISTDSQQCPQQNLYLIRFVPAVVYTVVTSPVAGFHFQSSVRRYVRHVAAHCVM